MKFFALGDSGVLIELGNGMDPITHNKVLYLSKVLEKECLPGLTEVVPGVASVAVYYDPVEILSSTDGLSPFQSLVARLTSIVENITTMDELIRRRMDIPVCYGGDFGPDLDYVASYHGLTPEEVVKLHTEVDYIVYMIGFAPGFPYLGNMNMRLETPRRSSPRVSIPAGSVGIGGAQTGVYPIVSPGGWNLIGRTPLKLFSVEDESPTLIRMGDIIRFRSVTEEQYYLLKGSLS